MFHNVYFPTLLSVESYELRNKNYESLLLLKKEWILSHTNTFHEYTVVSVKLITKY